MSVADLVCVEEPATQVLAADTSGAGDAFNAGFLAGVLSGLSGGLDGLPRLEEL